MKDRSDLPSVSIIMPIRNEAHFIARSLGAVLGQDYPQECFEIIVVDGMSTDGTRDAISEFQQRYPNVRLIDNPERIASTALNRAMNEASGDIIIRVDGHCEIASDYVRRCVDHLLTDGVDGVGGSVETVGDGITSQSIALAMSSRFGVGGSDFRTLSASTRVVDTIPFPAYTRRIIDRAGPYDEEQVRNQDDEYNFRIRALGGKLLLARDVRSVYYSRGSFSKLWRQYFQYGFWKVRVMQKHPKQMRLRQFVPPAFVASILCAIAITAHVGLLPFGLLAGLYVIANLTASVITASKKDLSVLPLLPIAFATLHLSYGSGFLIGLVWFWNRWGDRANRFPVWGETRAGQTIAEASNAL